jgi:hypothetical protein
LNSVGLTLIGKFLRARDQILTKSQWFGWIFAQLSVVRNVFMRGFKIIPFFSLAFVFSASVALSANSSQRDFVVPADDGYGMDDCLAEGGPCAKLIADSWCQVNGMKASVSYSAADMTDMTASLSKKASKQAVPSYIVTCAD